MSTEIVRLSPRQPLIVAIASTSSGRCEAMAPAGMRPRTAAVTAAARTGLLRSRERMSQERRPSAVTAATYNNSITV